jgi:hypothetical protein
MDGTSTSAASPKIIKQGKGKICNRQYNLLTQNILSHANERFAKVGDLEFVGILYLKFKLIK